MSSDCQFFSTFIQALNNGKPDPDVPANCCQWDKLECDAQGNIIKLDLSKYKFPYTGALPQTVETLANLKEFSISGQKGITNIYHLQNNNLEKLDLSDSGMKTQTFPQWIANAPKLKELDISGTEISGAPENKFVSNISNCNFSKTPFCETYTSSPYANNVPEVCVTSCTKGGAAKSKTSTSSEGSNSLVYILIGVALVLILGLCAFLYLKKSKKNKEFYDEYAQSHSGNNIKRDDSVEITVNDKVPLSPKGNLPATTAVNNVSYNNQSYNNQSYNNQSYNNSPVNGKNNYNGNVDPEQSFQPHPSIYNTMTTDVDSDEDDSNIINQPIVSGNQDIPALLRRKSSRKTPINEASEVQEAAPQNYASQSQEELYIANWDYTPTLSDELALTAGDVIEIKKKFDDGWCTGYNRRTNLTGIVPLCYLKEYED